MSKTILLAGGTGLIGSRLAEMLRMGGHEVLLLSRRPNPSKNIFGWNPAAGTVDDEAVRRADFVVNLAGAGIADGRWTASRKREIIESRTQSARTLRDAFQRTGHQPQAYISASAIGFYGNAGDRLMHETDPPGTDGFMPPTCAAWEQAADEVTALGIRTVKIRIGIVLAKEGGALAEIVKPLHFGLGTYFADGQAWYSWVHRDDVCRMFIWAIENQAVMGVFNAVAPAPARNVELVKAAAKAMHQPAVFVPAPALALRVVLGEMADVVLNSTRVSAEKIEQAGFKFQFPDLAGALQDIFRKN